MLDMNFIKNNPGLLDEALANRNKGKAEAKLIALHEAHKNVVSKLQLNQEKRNVLSSKYAALIALEQTEKSNEEAAKLREMLEILKKEAIVLAENEQISRKNFFTFMNSLPNIPLPECPVGKDEQSNVEIRKIGKPRSFDFAPLEHFDIGARLGKTKLGMMNFEKATKIAGPRFVFLFSKLAKLERALAQFMLDVHTKENGYTEVYVPLILGEKAMFGVGQLPKFEEDLFKTTVGSYLIPTAEAALTNVFYDDILLEKELPIRLTAYTPCFRSEAGAAGRDTKGMLRQHQFGKVELVSLTTPEQSKNEHERMTECAEGILKKLGLPFRTVVLSTGDMGFSSEKTYDIEVWLPGQGAYREISSCSMCNNFQARRMNTRFKNEKMKKNEFVHTLNGSGVAVGRCVIAILENYQQKDGSVLVPEVLVPYFGETEII